MNRVEFMKQLERLLGDIPENDRLDAIAYYNDLVDVLRKQGREDMIPVIDDIANEENKHVGQLQELMKQLSPNTVSIAEGEEEGSEQMNDKTPVPMGNINPDPLDMWDIDYPVDDDFGANSGFEMYLI